MVNGAASRGNSAGTVAPEASRTEASRSGRSSISGIVRGTSIQAFGESELSRPAPGVRNRAASQAESSYSGRSHPQG